MPEGVERGIDPRTTALVRLAGLVALQSSPQAYEWCVAAALSAGSSEEEVVAVLAALAPVVGDHPRQQCRRRCRRGVWLPR